MSGRRVILFSSSVQIGLFEETAVSKLVEAGPVFRECKSTKKSESAKVRECKSMEKVWYDDLGSLIFFFHISALEEFQFISFVMGKVVELHFFSYSSKHYRKSF